MSDTVEQSAAMRVRSSRAVQSVAQTRLIPPRGARQLMPRETLMKRLLDARRQRCVVIQGPAGSAKTSVLLAWRQALLTLDFDVAWLSLSPEDDDLVSFFSGLLGSLAAVDEAIGRETGLLVGRAGEESAAEHWVITLVRGIAERKRDLVLMLDDAHFLKDPRVVAGAALVAGLRSRATCMWCSPHAARCRCRSRVCACRASRPNSTGTTCVFRLTNRNGSCAASSATSTIRMRNWSMNSPMAGRRACSSSRSI